MNREKIEELMREQYVPTLDENYNNETSIGCSNLSIETREAIISRIEKARNATVPDSELPDLKKRLVACGLLDRINEYVPMSLPQGGRGTDPEAFNTGIQEPGFVIVGSDVKKLYPSLKPLEAARLMRMAVL